jgi:hypothetical protein
MNSSDKYQAYNDNKNSSKLDEFGKKLMKYPNKLIKIFWNNHFGKFAILVIIITVGCILISNGYNINGDYPELTDLEKKELEKNGINIDDELKMRRFLTVLLNMCLVLFSGIISIILGVESYKSFLYQSTKTETKNYLLKWRNIKKTFNEIKKKIRGEGLSDKNINEEEDPIIKQLSSDLEKTEDIPDENEQKVKISNINGEIMDYINKLKYEINQQIDLPQNNDFKEKLQKLQVLSKKCDELIAQIQNKN